MKDQSGSIQESNKGEIAALDTEESRLGLDVVWRSQEKHDSKDWWDKFDIFSKFLIAAATLVFTVLSWVLVTWYDRRATERQALAAQRAAETQAQAAIDSREQQRKSAAAQLVPALIPTLTRGSETERRIAFEALASVAPELSGKLSIVLAEQATTTAEKQFAKSISGIAAQAQTASAFLQHLGNARVYLRFQSYGQADLEYLRAAKLIPHEYQQQFQIDQRELEEAKSAYSDGRFAEAAKGFEAAFQHVPTQ